MSKEIDDLVECLKDIMGGLEGYIMAEDAMFFVCLDHETSSHRVVTRWLNSLVGSDISSLSLCYAGDKELPTGHVVRVINWQFLEGLDGAYVAIACVEVKLEDDKA
jgi:uncharacterized membrane protein YdcZ (DUF606 family)